MRSLLLMAGSVFWLSFTIHAQNPEAYRIYNAKGEQVSFEQMSDDLLERDVVLFGELHNNPICHWLQLELAEKAANSEKPVAFGAEMFERDNQLVINEYLTGRITADHLEKEAKVWTNHKTDYLPLLDVAKAHNAPFIATNVPRRYASMVAKKGLSYLDELDAAAKAFMPPLPFEVTKDDSGYKEMETMMGGGHGMGMSVENLIAAQALKDYCMADGILKNQPKDGVFIHFNGSFHSQNYSGMHNYLKAANSKLRVGTIAAVEADDLTYSTDWKGLGDYILVTPSNMCKTH